MKDRIHQLVKEHTERRLSASSKETIECMMADLKINIDRAQKAAEDVEYMYRCLEETIVREYD